MRHVLILSAAYIVILSASYTAFYFGLGVERLDALSNFGSKTCGRVAEKQPHNHRSIIYYFSVDGVQYTGEGGSGRGNPDFDDLKVGDQVVVYYEQTHPVNSSLGEPKYQAQADRTMAVVASVIVSTMIMMMVTGLYFAIRQIINRKVP